MKHSMWIRLVLIAGLSMAGGLAEPAHGQVRKQPVKRPATRQPVKRPVRVKPPVVKSSTRTFERADVTGKYKLKVTLSAPVTLDPRALDYLERTIKIAELTPAAKRDIAAWSKRSTGASRNVLIRVSLAGVGGSNAANFVVLPADGFELAGPGLLQLKNDFMNALRKSRRSTLRSSAPSTRKRKGGTPKAGIPAGLHGTIMCRGYDSEKNNSRTDRPMPFAKVRVGDAEDIADENGVFEIPGEFGTGTVDLHISYDGTVTWNKVSSGLKVMDDFHGGRGESKTATARVVGGKMSLGTVVLSSVDCEIWRIGAAVLMDYHTLAGKSPPAGQLRFKRWSGIWDGTPYAYYDYVVLTTNFGTKGNYKNETWRRQTLFHEFGHTVRHVADGNELHWGWDNFRWAYARTHGGCETFNTQYAFNEGWAGYWSWRRASDSRNPCYPDPKNPNNPDPAKSGFTDWTEKMITRELVALHDALPGTNDQRSKKMVAVLERYPGSIHSLRDFEVRYCYLYNGQSSKCRGRGVPTRARPSSCPPGFNDDGATCRLINIVAKPSYGRGVGVPPQGCPSGKENNAGLCYKPCRSGYSGVGPVCWQRCPSSFRDDGAYCAKPAPYGRGAGFPWQFGDPPFDLGNAKRRCERKHGSGKCEQNGLIWYPKCRAGFHAAGCCVCSPNCTNGMADIGVSCQKKSYGRGAGTIPTSCPSGKEKDAGLCYSKCRTGYNGVGPVCWGKCPAGFADHGATCYKDPNILVKY